MRNVTLEELLEAGCHFGHQVTRQNPKARDYIFEARDNINIIDLAKTKEGLDEAAEYVRKLAKNGGSMIILGAKRQAEPLVKESAKRTKDAGVDGLYFVTNRWIGGILTNFPEVSKNFKKLKQLTQFMSTPAEKARFKKKEIALMEKERQKLESFYWGVQDMTKIPDAVFIIDTHLEDLAVREALAMRVKTVGITDTNADPTIIDYAIPANDDAVGSVKLILDHIIDAWIEGADEHKRGARLQAEGADKRGTEAQSAKDEGQKTEGKVKKEDKVAAEKVKEAQEVDAKSVKEKELTKAVKTPEKKVLEKAKTAKKEAKS